MLQNWLTLLPPLFVIFGAIITHRIHLSLLIGIFTASFIGCHGDFSAAITLAITTLFETAFNSDNLYLYAFLIVIGALVSLFSVSGVALSFAQAVTRRISNSQQAQYSSMLISVLLFIDDYLSILTTGYVMNPITDRFQISREKLAFLVHSMAGPVVILAPISSWVATIIAYLDQVGVSVVHHDTTRIAADPFFIFLKTIPFIFYSFLVILSVWYIIYRKISFGPMRQCEQEIIAVKKVDHPSNYPASISNLLIPIAVLVLGIVIGFPLAGDYWLFGGKHQFIDALKCNKHPFFVMLIASLLALFVSFVRCYQKSLISFAKIPHILKDGYNLMISAIMMVYFASAFSSLLANTVGTGQYLASVLIGSVSLWFLPAMFFIVSLICTIATGSAWGSFALMIPIAIPMLTTLSGLQKPIDPVLLPLLFPMLGAILSGAVCGDHISPLSETTTMAATSTGTKTLSHTYTQLPYAIPAILSSAVGFVIVGFLTTKTSTLCALLVAAGISAFLNITMLWLLNKRS